MTRNSAPKIEFVAVGKNYAGLVGKIAGGEEIVGRIPAVKDFSMKVASGEFITLVGPSGCGKTTVLNLAAGFIEPTSGDIYRDGKTGFPFEQRYGMVFQSDAVFPWMTVSQNIGYSLDPDGNFGASVELVSGYLDLLGLSGFENRFPRELSGGMRKRVELGRAYVSAPDVLLLDEPFGSLDVITKQEMQALLSKIWERDRKTVLFVSHDVEEAVFLSDLVMVMSPRPGTIKEAFTIPFGRPRNPALRLTYEFLQLRKSIIGCLEQ